MSLPACFVAADDAPSPVSLVLVDRSTYPEFRKRRAGMFPRQLRQMHQRIQHAFTSRGRMPRSSFTNVSLTRAPVTRPSS